MASQDDDECYSYHSDRSAPGTPITAFVRGSDAVNGFLVPEGSGLDTLPTISRGAGGVSFFTSAEAGIVVNSSVTDIMRVLSQMGCPVGAERAFTLLLLTGSLARTMDLFSREQEEAEGLFACSAPPAQAPLPQGPFECAVTGEEYDSAAAAGAAALACGHWFSWDAWRGRLLQAAKGFPSKLPCDTRCPKKTCGHRIPLSWWLRVLPPARHAAFREACIREVFSRTPTTVPCPGEGCDYYCRLEAGSGVRGQDVRCPREHSFCSGCGEKGVHQPATCLQVRDWNKPANSETAMEMYKTAMVKGDGGKMERAAHDCPKCGALVEKAGGCRHFTHAKDRGGCGAQFCWSCLKTWPCKDNYQCNEEPSNVAPSHLFAGLEKGARVDMVKLFRWAFDKFNAADSALGLDRRLCAELRHPSGALGDYYESILVKRGGSFAGGIRGLILEGSEVLLAASHAVKWTYVVAYCKGGEETFLRALFEDAQGLLEKELKALRESLKALHSGFHKRDVTEERALELRLKVLNQKENLTKFKAALFDVRPAFRDGFSPFPPFF